MSLRTLQSYLVDEGVLCESGTVESWVDQAVTHSKNAKEAIVWLGKQKDVFVKNNMQKIVDMIDKLPKALFASEEIDEPVVTEDDSIDWDTIEEYYDEDEEPIDEDDASDIDEAVRRKRVVRGGKVMIKKKTDKSGYKVKNGKEVRMTSQERMKRKRASIKAARKRKGRQSMIQKKRKRSMTKRTWTA